MHGLSAEEFYRRRNDRTDRVTPSRDYHRLPVRIVAAAETTRTFSGQVQLLVAANLLARWCRQVEFGFPDAQLAERLRAGNANTLHTRVATEVRQADPFGAFTFGMARSLNTGYVLKVGGKSVGEPVDFTIDADGWDVRAGAGDRAFDLAGAHDNPVGPAFAACVAVADAFKVAIGEREICACVTWPCACSTSASMDRAVQPGSRRCHRRSGWETRKSWALVRSAPPSLTCSGWCRSRGSCG